MIDLFGWSFKRNPKDEIEPVSFSPKAIDDGAINVMPIGAYGAQAAVIDLDGTVKSDAELITRYRQMTENPECDHAIDEIISEMIAAEYVVKIILDELKDQGQSKKVLDAIDECFKEVVELLDFRRHGYDIARRWYVDGRLYFHVIIDPACTTDGIKEVRYVDPRKICKVREQVKKAVRGSAANSNEGVVTQTKNEYFVYSDKGFAQNTRNVMAGTLQGGIQGIKISKDAIVHVTSGLTNAMGTMVLSYLHKALKPLNQLRSLEDAALIYRLVRSSERRVWYIDIGNLPKLKAEQYVADIMTKHKNKLMYDANTGEVQNNRKFITMLEDYWLPQRDGKGTKVDVLPPGASFNQIEDILYFQKKLYQSLNVPIGRLDPEQLYNDSVATQITRDEVKFGKFIERMRNRFGQLFVRVLEKQLVLKQVMKIEEFQKIAPYLKFDFVKDNYFMEMKEKDVFMGRSEMAMSLAPFIGKYFSNEWVRENVFKQTEEDMKVEDAKIEAEMENPQFALAPGEEPPQDEEQQPDDPGNPAVIADQNAIEAPPNQQKPPDSATGGGAKPDPSKRKKPAGKNFKSVASLLAKNT